MTNHAKVFLDSRNLTPGDVWLCEWCSKPSLVDNIEAHHIRRRGMGGNKKLDYPQNLIGLCRECHQRADANLIGEEELTERATAISKMRGTI